jgi:hypothetical protein
MCLLFPLLVGFRIGDSGADRFTLADLFSSKGGARVGAA